MFCLRPHNSLIRLLAALLTTAAVACGDKDSDGSDGGDGEDTASSDRGDSTGSGGDGAAGGGDDSDGSGSGSGSGSDGDGDSGVDSDSEASVYPQEPTTADTLQCLFDGALAVAEGSPVTWAADGVEQVEQADSDVGPEDTRTGQQWTCTVAADAGPASSEAVTVSACGGALAFTGGSVLSRSPSQLATDITVEAWLRLDGTEQGTFLTVGRGPYHGLDLHYTSSLELNYKWGNWNDQWERWYSGTTLHDSGWHHLAVVFEEPNFRIYVDGRYASGTSSPETLRFDDSYGFTLALSSGLVDEVHISRSVRYNSNFTPPYPLVADSETDLLLHLDEGRGTVVVDHGPDQIPGTTTAARSPESVGCSE